MVNRSPLKAKPLRNPGDSAEAELQHLLEDKVLEPMLFAGGFIFIAAMEWIAVLTHAPRQPILFSIAALVATLCAIWRLTYLKGRIRALRQGRDGEKAVGQYLERFREGGGQVFHDVPGDGFNVDHVIICAQGVYAVETKTFSKPSPRSTVVVDGDSLMVAGRLPDRNPIEQARAAANWLARTLQDSCGKALPIKPVVVFPGWFVESKGARSDCWVLEPKALPGWIDKEALRLSQSDIKLASFHLSRYIRSEVEKS